MERMDYLVNQFMQQHNLKLDDLFNYLVARKNKEQMIPLKKETLAQIKPGMYWYDDDTVSFTYYPDRRLKSMVLAVYNDHIIGDTFHETNRITNYNFAMCEISSFESTYIKRGQAHKATLKDLESVLQNKEVINAALRAIEKPRWRFFYWTDSINKYENDWYKKEKKWHYIVDMERSFPNNYCHTAPDNEKADARPLLYFALH